MTDHNALSYWFPLVRDAGLPVPMTRIVTMPEDAHADLWALFDNKPQSGAMVKFGDMLREASVDLGFPVFLRSDHTSGKHEWASACYVTDLTAIESHVASIAYYSEIAWLPWRGNWAVREFLPTRPVSFCPQFDGMPVCKEFRFFVNDGEVECFHPYWPREALDQGGCVMDDDAFANLCAPSDEREMRQIAEAAGRAVGGRWSIDLLETERGWFLTDMAEAHRSYHWPQCCNLEGC